MAGVLHLLEQRRLIDSDGISDGGQIAFYLTETSVLSPIYSDVALTTPLTNPVVVGAGGAVPDIYLDAAITYRRVITYADGSIEETDPYTQPDYLAQAAASATAAATSATASAASATASAGSAAASAVSADEAEGYKDVIIAAMLSGGAFTDTTVAAAITAGLAATSSGGYFVATGDDITEVRQYQDVAGVATLIYSLPKASALAALGAAVVEQRAADLKAAVIAAAGGTARINCLLTKDGTITYKAGTTASEIDEIRPLLPATGLKFGQHATTWNGNGSPIAALAVRPVVNATGIGFTREVGFTAMNDGGTQVSAMPSLAGNFSLAAVVRMPAIFTYTLPADRDADLANRRVGDIAYVSGAPNPTVGGAYDPLPADCLSITTFNTLETYWTGGYYIRGNAVWDNSSTISTPLLTWYDSTAPTTKFCSIGFDRMGRLVCYGFDGTTQIENLMSFGANSNFLDIARNGPVLVEIEKDADEIVLYVNGAEYRTYNTALNFTPDRFSINGKANSGNATVPINGTSFALDALVVTNGLSHKAVLETHNTVARAFACPERKWRDTAYAAIITDQSRFQVAVGGNAGSVSTTPSIPDPVSNWAFILGQRTNTDAAINAPSRDLVPNVFAAANLTNSHQLGPLSALCNIFGTTTDGRTMSGSNTETIEWGLARELQRAPAMANADLYYVGACFGGYSESALKAEHPTGYLHGLLDPGLSFTPGTYPRTAANRALANIAKRARKRGQKLVPLFIGNFQGETGAPINEGRGREDDLRNWWTNQISKICASDCPPPVVAAKSIMFSGDGTSNSYNTEGYVSKDHRFLEREGNMDKDFRFILFGSTGNWMGRGIHWEAVKLRDYGMIIGDRVRRAYFGQEIAGATKITNAVVGTAGNAGKIVLTVNRRLAMDSGGNPMMPGVYKSDGLNGTGHFTYGLLFESHATATVTFAGVVADGDTVTVGATVYTFRNSARAAHEVEIADTAAGCAANLLAALHTDGVVYTNYGTGTVANTSAWGSINGAVVRLYAFAVGTAGNSVALAKVGTNITVSGSTLSGADDTRAINGDVTFTNQTRTATVLVPISGSGPKIGDVIRVTGTGVLFSNFREETTRVGYYNTQAWGSLPLADSSPTIDYSATSNLSDYLAPQRAPVTA